MKKRIIPFYRRVLIFSVTLGLISVSFQAAALANEPIRIAAIFSKSGEAVAISIEHLVTIRFAVKEINANGGILGRQIELVELDNQSSALGARKAALKALQKKVVAVVGGSWSSHALGMAPVLQKAKIPMLSPTATNPKVTKIGDFIFRVCFIDSFQGQMLAQFAHETLNAQEIVVLTNVDQVYSIDLSRQFISSFTSLGKKITIELDYAESLTEYKELIQDLSTYEFDAVMLPGYARDSAQIIKTARKMGIKKVFLGGDGWSHLMMNYALTELNNTYYLTHWHKNLQDEKTIQFVDKIIKEFDHLKINAGMALSYDMIYLLADAIKRAGSAQPIKIRDSLALTDDFEGVTGRIQFDENRNPIKSAIILKFENGKSKVVKQISP